MSQLWINQLDSWVSHVQQLQPHHPRGSGNGLRRALRTLSGILGLAFRRRWFSARCGVLCFLSLCSSLPRTRIRPHSPPGPHEGRMFSPNQRAETGDQASTVTTPPISVLPAWPLFSGDTHTKDRVKGNVCPSLCIDPLRVISWLWCSVAMSRPTLWTAAHPATLSLTSSWN